MKNQIEMLPHNKLTIGSEEAEAAKKVLESGWLAQGAEVSAFEDEFCNFLGLPQGHAVALSSCSVAIYLSLMALNAQNKSVAMPVYVSRVLKGATKLAGGEAIFLDTKFGSPNIDIDVVKKLSPDILIAPHMFGIPIDLRGLDNIDVIENCAHSLGGMIGSVSMGLQGKIGVYSFQATKLMTSGGMGGMLVSKDRLLIDRVRNYRDFDENKDIGNSLNFKMSDIQAAIGRVQLKKLPSWIEKRERIFNIYKHAGLELLDVDVSERLYVKPVRYRAVVQTRNAEKCIKLLHDKGFKSIIPIERWELLSNDATYANAINLTERTISLPIYPELKESQAAEIAFLLKGKL